MKKIKFDNFDGYFYADEWNEFEERLYIYTQLKKDAIDYYYTEPHIESEYVDWLNCLKRADNPEDFVEHCCQDWSVMSYNIRKLIEDNIEEEAELVEFYKNSLSMADDELAKYYHYDKCGNLYYKGE